MADSINSNNPAVDGMGRSYAGIDLDMLKNLMSGKVGDAKPFNSKGTDEIKDELQKLAQLLGAKNAGFVKELQKAVKYIDEMKKVLSSISTKVGSKEEKTNFGDMANALGKVLAPMLRQNSNSTSSENIRKAIINSNSELRLGFRSMERASNHLSSVFYEFIKMMEPFVDEGLKKGSIFTRDERLSQKIGKGIKLEKGTLQKLGKSMVTKSGERTKGFAEAFSDIKPEFQDLIAEIFKEASTYANNGLSEIEAYARAFQEQTESLNEEEKKQLRQNKDYILERARALEKEQKFFEHGIKDFALKNLAKIADHLTGMVQDVVKVDISLSGLKKGVTDLFNAQSDLKQAMFETSGSVGQTAAHQKEIANLSRTIAETGFDGTVATQQMVKYQRSGLKLNKDTTKIVKAQLSVEKQLGLEAGSMQEHFKSMSMEAGFSSGQIEQMGRDMSNVAKSSGLSGEAMKDVVQKTRELTKLLQSSGTLTVDANKNVLSFMAEAKKMGVEEGASSFAKALTSMDEFNKTQDKFLQSAVANTNTWGKVFDRSLLGDKNALLEVTRQYTKNVTAQLGEGINSYTDFQKAFQKAKFKGDEKEIQRLSAARENIQRATGKTLEEALKVPEALIKGIEEANEPLQKKIEKINKNEEKGLIDKAQKEQQIKKVQADTATSLLSKMQEVAMASDNVADFSKYLNKEGGNLLKDMEAATPEEALANSLKSVNERLKDAGVKELNFSQDLLKEAISGGQAGQDAMTQIQEKTMAALREADEKEMRKNNPAYQAAQYLGEIKEMLSSWGAEVLWAIGALGLAIGAVAAALGSGSALYGLFKKGQDLMGKITARQAAPPAPPPTPAPPPRPGPSAPAPPPREGKPLAPAPPPNIDGKGTTKGAKGTLPPKEKAKAEDAASKPKGKTSAKAVGAEPGKTPLAGKKPVTPKGKAPSAKVKGKGKLGAVMSGGSALAGGLAETALDVIGGGGDDGGCACSIAESALSKVSGIAGIATDVAMTAGEAALDATKKTGKAAANAADDAAKGAMKGAAKATAKGVAGSVDDAAIAATKSAGVMSKATGFLGKTVGVLGKVAGPLASVAGAGIEIAAGGDVTEAISGGAGGLIGGALLGTVGTFIGGPLGTAVGGAIGAYAGDWLGRIGSEYLPGVWDGVKSVASTVAEVGSEMWNGAKDIGANLYEGAKSVAGGIADGAVSLAKGIDDFTGGRISAATETLGNVASSVGSGIGSAASYVGSGISSAASSVGSGISAGWSSFTGWLGFNEGAREIENSGLAMLHKGEVIFPKSIVETLISKGTSSFGSLGGYLQDVGGGLASAASNFVESGGIGGMLGSAVTKLGSSLSNVASNIFGSPSKMQGEMASAEIQTGASKASTLATAGSAALNSIANATESQTSISNEIKSVLKEILNEMVKANNAASGGDSEPYVGMSSSRDAFKSPIGNINDVAVRNVQQVAYG